MIETLIQIIKKAMKQLENTINDTIEQNNSSFGKYQLYKEQIQSDIQAITSITPDELKDILSETSLSEEEKQQEFRYVKYVIDLLRLNQTKNTTFQLSDKQRSYIVVLIQQLEELEEKRKDVAQAKLQEIISLQEKMKELKRLLGKIEDPKNRELITQTDYLQEIFQQVDVDPTTQKQVLYEVLKYNRDLYQEKMKGEEIIEKERLNMEEVKEIFQEYHYNFLELNESLQDQLLTYGALNKIKEILEILKQLKFPRIDLKRNGKKLVAIILNCNKDTIKDAVDFCNTKGIHPFDLLNMIPAMVKQSTNKTDREPSDGSFNPLYIVGRNEDFKKNIELIEEIGFNVHFILKKCKEILLLPHERLETNYRKFILYGFTIQTDQYGDLCHPALSCLMAKNFDEIVDQYIEICREGHQYIKDNMSRITTTISPHDILFYNIYASNMDQDELGEPLTKEGPFSKTNYKKLRLRREITRYTGSGFEEVPYRGITEENKKEKTMTVDIQYKNQKEFEEAVLDAKNNEADLYDLVYNDPQILELEEYVDIGDPARYVFDGVLISKQKVLRIYNAIKNKGLDQLDDSLLFAITYNSILSQESLEKIKRIIKARSK